MFHLNARDDNNDV